MCLTLCDPRDHTVHGILQARTLEWVAFPFSRGSSSPGIEPRSPEFLMDSFPAEPPGKPFSSFLFFFFGLNSCQTNNALLSTCFLLNYGVSERTIKSTFPSINCRFVHQSIFITNMKHLLCPQHCPEGAFLPLVLFFPPGSTFHAR